MSTLTGTVLGGPRDGEVADGDRPVVLMQDPSEVPYGGKITEPETGRVGVSRYDFRQDDEGRCWWLYRGAA